MPSQEAVFVTLHNTLTEGVPDYRKNNTWENGIRPYNARGGGGKTPSAMLVDMFPMSDGKIPATCETYTTLTKSDIAYYREFPSVDRDPRFYRTFAFPGVRWSFVGNPTTQGNRYPHNGPDYELWNYTWYTDAAYVDDIEANSSVTYGADGLL